MNARTAVSQTQSPRTVPPFKNRRVTNRESIHCRVTYTYEAGDSTYAVDGVTQDVCKIGCGIRGTIIPPVGSKTRLKLYLGAHTRPISLSATISWMAGDYFGVRFNEMNKQDYTRVRRYMWTVLNTAA
ncbi:MAG TPA: PilZ domain-containing protein [Nitrospiraceae bacterium]|nr:PilZ domain-containing protein [Nitrospiraceae bacterium]